MFDLYCTREHGCVAFECRKHDGLHIDTGSVFVEITRNGKRVAPGETGEITITDLANYGMPFIRSRTGDLGALTTRPCPCGLPFPLLAGLDGRAIDCIYTPSGSTVSGLMLSDLFVELPGLRLLQFVQDSLSRLDVNVVTTADLSSEVEQKMIHEVRELVGQRDGGRHQSGVGHRAKSAFREIPRGRLQYPAAGCRSTIEV